jgi:hypothetical protein
MQVIKRTIKINGAEYVQYIYNGKTYQKLSDLLFENFQNHGEFYKKIFGVDEEDAKLAGWSPSICSFSRANIGFEKFIKDKGKIKKEIIEETISLKEAVEQEYFKD